MHDLTQVIQSIKGLAISVSSDPYAIVHRISCGCFVLTRLNILHQDDNQCYDNCALHKAFRKIAVPTRGFHMINIATACGVGMGSSLVLRMYTEDVLKELGVEANVEAMDVPQAKAAKVDLVLTSPALVEVVSGGRGVVKGISNYIDKSLIRAALIEYFEENDIPYNK